MSNIQSVDGPILQTSFEMLPGENKYIFKLTSSKWFGMDVQQRKSD